MRNPRSLKAPSFKPLKANTAPKVKSPKGAASVAKFKNPTK